MIDCTLCIAPGPRRVQGVKPNSWTEAEDAVMHSRYPELGPTRIGPLLPGRTLKAIKLRAGQLNVRCKRYREWSPESDEAIRARYPSEGGNALAAEHGVEPITIRKRAVQLGVKVIVKPLPPPRQKGAKAPARHPKKLALTVMRKSAKKPAQTPQLVGEPIITSATIVTIAAPFVDSRFAPDGPVSRVVDSAQCRPWAKASA